ncbi:MAG: acetyl-CoA carboxylase, biotin carboxylase subunit [Blastocatellia bacterium]|jgi:acetyl-CoA carboxylase biotin carboxylase subunit|nr:acetyl-CoA carboxylase, biotin carboxylase subunit [Blastocatellia bacterium]
MNQLAPTGLPALFKKILIANRGEIAVRVIRACRDLSISPVAIYSEADAAALHVRLADEAVCIGPAASVDSYLNINAVIGAARQVNADAIHPGYGFLAENADFVRAASAARIVFIGPTAAAMEVMGSKTSARRAAIAAGVAVVPGTTEALKTFSEARDTAARFGYPIMLKAAAGGGGKGMRLVHSESELESSLAGAQSEAAAAFGNDAVYIEKAVEVPRHIEIQVFADTHGNVVHLGERECSIQRRHQKVIEECPSPINDPDLRARMGAAAVKIAQAVDYVGAGTVEFLLADTTREFYFLEMNTRLQVEHPVTELVTGIDLVREQINVAAGARLSFTQDDVRWNGHAIECRVYAEDPENNFFPSPGRITFLRVPAGPGIRDDGGVSEGADVSIHYDPMISKLAAWGRTRDEAIDRLRRALDEYAVSGIKTTLPFFRQMVRDEEFRAGKLDTGFITRFLERRAGDTADSADPREAQRKRDLAIIAAGLDYAGPQTPASPLAPATESNAWRIAGRSALLRARQPDTARLLKRR